MARGSAGSRLGAAVDIDGMYALVGAPADGHAPSTSAAYLFGWTGSRWAVERELSPYQAQRGDGFGMSVLLLGDRAIVGAPRRDVDGETDCGAAYVFQEAAGEWQQCATLTPRDSVRGRAFGSSLSMLGDTLLVGAPSRQAVGSGGAVHLLELSEGGWQEAGEALEGEDPAGGFGWSIAGDAGTVVIGAPYEDGGDGAVYLFDFAGETPRCLSKLKSPAAVGRFGWSVAIRGREVLVGAPYADVGRPDSGTAYIYRVRDDGSVALLRQYRSPLGGEPHLLPPSIGRSVAIADGIVVVSAPAHNALILYDDAGERVVSLPGDVSGFGFDFVIDSRGILVGAPSVAYGRRGHFEPNGAVYLLRSWER